MHTGCRKDIFVIDGNAKLDVRVCVEGSCFNPPAHKGTVCEDHQDLEQGLAYYVGMTSHLYTGGCFFLMCPCGCYYDSTVYKGNYHSTSVGNIVACFIINIYIC